MSDRHRHDEFIWALVFSLLVNLLFVLALLAQRSVAKSSGVQPFVVTITASHRALAKQSLAIPGPTVIPAPAKSHKVPEPPPTFQPQSSSIAPLLPVPDNEGEAAISPVTAPERAEEETALPVVAPAGESPAATTDKETADGRSIGGDKIAEGYYTAAEYLAGEKPPYPKRAARNGWEGTVLLTLLININGEVGKVGIAKSSGYELLDRQACASVGAWRFKPARRNGSAIAVTILQPITFGPILPENTP